SLSGSGQTAPTFWLDPSNGVSYTIATQAPEYRLTSLQALGNIPVTADGDHEQQVLQGLTTVSRGTMIGAVSHYNAQPVVDVFGAVQDRDLGSVMRAIQPIVQAAEQHLPRGTQLIVRGQSETMQQSFAGLLEGLAFAIVLVYLLIVVNFQSWL